MADLDLAEEPFVVGGFEDIEKFLFEEPSSYITEQNGLFQDEAHDLLGTDKLVVSNDLPLALNPPFSHTEFVSPSSPLPSTSSPEYPSFTSPDRSPLGSSSPEHNSPNYSQYGFPFQPPASFVPLKIKEEKEESDSTNKKKRPLQSQILLSRDELLRISSDHYEQIVQYITAERPLTVEEERLYKRQKRLIKNRESAQISRNRKKSYVGELEQQIAELKAQNEALANENRTLKSENASLKTLLKKQSPAPRPKVEKTALPENKKAVTLLALFFFAFMFGFGPSFHQNAKVPIEMSPVAEANVPIRIGRVLHALEPSDVPETPSQSSLPVNTTQELAPQSRLNSGVLAKYVSHQSKESRPQKRSRVNIQDDDEPTEQRPRKTEYKPVVAVTNPTKTEPGSELVPVHPNTPNPIFGGQWVKPNLYMFCPKYDIISGMDINITAHKPGVPRVFSFVVPANMFHSGGQSNGHFVEINTQILGIFPINQNHSQSVV